MEESIIVILPGWRGKPENFNAVLSYLKTKSIIVQLPGFTSKIEKPLTFSDYLNFLKNFFDYSGLKRFILLGHSFGGALALLFSQQYPEMVEKLIIYNGAIVRKKTLKSKIISFLVSLLKPLINIFPLKLREKLRYFLYRYLVRSFDYYAVDSEMKETFKNIQQDLTQQLVRVKVPTYLIWGTKDKITPWRDIKKYVLPTMKVFFIKGGHNLHLEKPKELAEVIKSIVED